MSTATLTEQQLIEELGLDIIEELKVKGFATHLFLDIVGVVGDLIPGGQPFSIASDVANAILYLADKPPQYLNAGLSLLSAIPAVGDVLGKGGKIAKSFSKVIKTAKPALKGGEMSKPVARAIATVVPKSLGGGGKMYRNLRTSSNLTYKIGMRIKNSLRDLEGLLKELGKKYTLFEEHGDSIVDEVSIFADSLINPEDQEPNETETDGDKEALSLTEQRNRMLVLAGIIRN